MMCYICDVIVSACSLSFFFSIFLFLVELFGKLHSPIKVHVSYKKIELILWELISH